jgi:hypothetical protein
MGIPKCIIGITLNPERHREQSQGEPFWPGGNLERVPCIRVITEDPKHLIADRVKSCRIDTDQCTGNIPGPGEGIYLINRVADGTLPHPFLGVIPVGGGINLFFSKDERMCDGLEILKNSRTGLMDTVTRADDENMFLRIHELYQELNDK